MRKLVECIPNFSEGKDAVVVEQISASICSVDGVTLLGHEMDPNHHRSVITFVGAPEVVEEAAFRGAKKAAELIHLPRHKGEHPRIGATDVIPFVPISGVTTEECAAIARRVAARIGNELRIPTYLYGEAATRASRAHLETIRKKQFEGLQAIIETDPDHTPDFGPRKMHPTAGATAVGARGPLIAFNINLATSDVTIAKEIAKSIRTSSGGFLCLKALGVKLETRGIAQVTMNLTNYEQTSIAAVFEAVRQKAAARGVEILSSEIIGLVPQKALIDVAAAHLKLEDFSHDRILENKLAELEKHGTVRPVTLTATPKGPETVPPTPPKLPLRAEVQTLLNAIAAPTPTPAGGSVSALSGACAAALGEMICRIILRRCDAQSRPPLEEILRKLTALRGELAQAFDADATAFNAVMAAYALRRETAAEIKQREAAIEKAMKGAVRVPLTVSKKSLETLELLQQLQGQAAGGVASDLAVAEQMAHAAAVGALTTVKSNLGSIHDETFVASVRREMTALE